MPLANGANLEGFLAPGHALPGTGWRKTIWDILFGPIPPLAGEIIGGLLQTESTSQRRQFNSVISG